MSSEEVPDADSPSGVVIEPGIDSTVSFGEEGQGAKFVYHWDNINVFSRKPPHGFERSMHVANQPPPPRKKGACFAPPAKQILRNVSGFIRPGQLYALMGASGAGKTTLLNVLHFNSRKLHVEGDRCMNGNPVGSEYISSISAYVQQEDLFIPVLTVREHLAFTARVKMNRDLSQVARMRRVDAVIHDLGLTKCQNSNIGDPATAKGISGGEMKRLAFASEYLSDPSILFCDEPTSGLDAFMAESVVEVMRKMAAMGKAIICTIHQPASEVFEMFDHIYLLSAGRVAFSGTITEALDFFSSLGLRCPLNHNPADFFIFTLAIMPGDEEPCRQRTDVVCDAFRNSPRYAAIEEVAKFRSEHPRASYKHGYGGTGKFSCCSHYRATWCTQFDALLRRNLLITFREPQLFGARLFQIILISLLTGVAFYQQANDQHGTKNICAVLFILMLNVSILSCFGTIFVFTCELPIFLRENWNNMYRSDAYFLSKAVAEFPFITIYAVLMVSIVYYMVGLYNSAYRFVMACVISTMASHTAASFGYFMSIICPNLTAALTVVPTALVPLFLFSGYFVREDPVFKIWDYAKYLSWFFYSGELLNINQWQDVDMLVPDGGANEENTTLMFLGDGSAVLIFLNYQEKAVCRDFVCLSIMVVAFRLMAYVALVVKASFRS